MSDATTALTKPTALIELPTHKYIIDLENRQLDPEKLFVPGGMDELLDELEVAAKSIVQDPATAAGRKFISSWANRIVRSRNFLDGMGKDYVAVIKRKPKMIDTERRSMRTRLDTLVTKIREPVVEFERREAARQQALRDRVAAIGAHQEAAHFLDGSATPAQVAEAIAVVQELQIDASYAEFQMEALQVRDATLYRLRQVLAEAEHRERLAAETRAAEEKARIEREEQIRQEAAAQAREEAERAANEAAARLQQEQEQRRLQQEQEILDAERRALEAERKQREAEEQANRRLWDGVPVTTRRPELTQPRPEELVNGTAVPNQSQHDQPDGTNADRGRADKTAAQHLAITREHRAHIHNEIAAELTLCGLTVDQARAVVVSIARGTIPHVQINY